MEFTNSAEAWDAVKKYCANYPDVNEKCQFGQLDIIQPDSAKPGKSSFYSLGFNGSAKKYIKNGVEALVPRFTNICKKAAEYVGVDYFFMIERCPWGSAYR